MSRPFVVVEFIREESVGVVHNSWVVHDKQAVYCYWPSSGGNIAKRVQKGEIPDKTNWVKVEIRILSYTDSYAQANKRAIRAEETSNIDSDDLEDSRKKNKPRRYESYSDSPSDDDVPVVKNGQKKAPQSKKIQCRLPKPPNPEGASGMSADRPNTARPASFLSTPRRPDIDVAGTPVGQDAFQRMVLMKLKKLQDNQQQILHLLAQRKGAEPMASTHIEIEDILTKPAEDDEEFASLNRQLEENPDKSKQLTQFLASLGGKDLSKQTRNVMRFVAKNPVWSRFSLKGRKKKEALEKLPIWRPILNALLKDKGCPSQTDVEFQVADFLKYAPHQQGGLLHKKLNMNAMEENPVPE